MSSTCSTSEAEAAWIGRRADRAGPTPTASNGTDGAPDELPARTTRFETVNGSRFSTFSVVLPDAPLRRLDRDERPGDGPVDGAGQGGAVHDGDRGILAERRRCPSGDQASAWPQVLTTIRPRVSPALASVRTTRRPRAGAEQGGMRLALDDLERQAQHAEPVELAVEPPRLAGERPLALDLDEDPRLGQGRRLDQVGRGRLVEGLDEPRGQGDLRQVHDLAGLLDHRLERQVVADAAT